MRERPEGVNLNITPAKMKPDDKRRYEWGLWDPLSRFVSLNIFDVFLFAVFWTPLIFGTL